MAFSQKPGGRFVTLALIGLLLIGGATATSASRNIYSNIKTYNSILANVYDKYVDDVDSQELIYASIEGMMSALDPHSAFLEKKQYENLMEETQGKYGGIGISIDIRDDWLTVVSPIEGTPAFNLGIRAGDRIIEIEGESTKGITTSEAANKLRGRKGTVVSIKIARKGEPLPLEVAIERDVIELKSVLYSGIVRDGIGYVRLIRFSEDSGVEIEKAVRSLVDQGIDGLVLDLRWNHGGLLTQAVSVSDKFLDKGKLISYTQGRHPSDRKEFYASERPVLPGRIPMVVLVNESTASASEIVAGALQDDGRAVVHGTLTYGKGLVQTLIPVDASASLKLTTAKWYTPAGRCIQKADREDEEPVIASADVEDGVEGDGESEIETAVAVGGIQPDVEFPDETGSRYVFEIERQNHFFKYAVNYVAEHDGIPRSFRADEATLADFRRFLEKQDFEYESVSERELERLRELAQEEEYDGSTMAALDALESRYTAEKNRDFDRNLGFIAQGLEREILSKTHGTEGRYEAGLRNDKHTQAAIDLLLDAKAYESALAGKAEIAAVGE